MAKEREITTKFKVDISDLKAGIQEANRHIRLANSEFKAATAGMDKWSDSADGLKAKIKQLNTVIGAEKDKLKALEEQYKRVAKECGASSKEAEEMAIKVNNQKAAVGKAEAELKKYTQRLHDVKSGATSFDKVGKAAKGAANDIDDASKSLSKLSEGFTVAKGAIATFAGNVLTSLAGSIKSGIGNMLQLSESTREYREQMNKLSVGAEDVYYSTDYAKEKYKELYSVLGDETAASTAISNFMALGTSEDNLNKLLNSSIGIWASYGDSIPLDGLAEAINETVRTGQVTGNLADALNWTATGLSGMGNMLGLSAEASEKFNEAVKEGASSEDLLNIALGDTLNKQEREALLVDILDRSYGSLSESYKETNKSIIESRKATSNYQDVLAKLGEKMEPVSTAMTKGFTKILEKVLELVEGVDMDKFIDAMDKGFTYVADDVIPKLIKGVKKLLPILMDGIKWVIDNAEVLAVAISAVGSVMAAIKIANFVKSIIDFAKGIKRAIDMVKGAKIVTSILNLVSKIKTAVSSFGALKVAFAALTGPVGIAVAVIGTLVAAFVTLWNKSDAFRNFWIGLWENIKSVVSAGIEAIKNFFSGVIEFVQNNWQGLLLLLVNPFAGAFKLIYDNCEGFRTFWNELWENIKSLASSAWEAIKGFFASAWEFIKSIWSGALAFFSDLFSTIASIALSVLESIRQFFSEAWEFIKSIWNEVKPYFETLAEAVKLIFDKLCEIIGKLFEIAWELVKSVWNLAAGFFEDVFNKIKDIFSEGCKKIADFMSDAWEKIKSIWSGVTGFFSDIWNGIKNIFGDVASWFGDVFGGAWEMIKSKFSGWGDFWSGLWTQIKDKFSGIGSSIGSAISDSVRSGINGILGLIEGTINKAIGLINGAIGLINLIPGVDIGTIGNLSLPRLYNGGILKKGQVGLLEGRGDEAVVPLHNNKKWIRKTAQDMNKELKAQKAFNSSNSGTVQNITNNNFTQNNNSPKSLSRLEIYRQTQNQLELLRG